MLYKLDIQTGNLKKLTVWTRLLSQEKQNILIFNIFISLYYIFINIIKKENELL